MAKKKVRGKCIFCGEVGILTGEHVISHWCHKYLPPRSSGRYSSLRATAYRDRTDFVKVWRTGDIRDTKIYCVCGEKCNNGWMRRNVENPSIPTLKTLILGKTTRIFPHQQRLIATWAVMKAMVAQYDESSHRTIHHTHRKYLMDHHSPPLKGWGVWIGHFSHHPKRLHPSPWVSTPFAVPSKHDPPRPRGYVPTHYNSATFTQVIGQLFVRCIQTPFPNFVRRFRTPLLPNGGTLLRIWPPSEISIPWPQHPLSDDDVHAASWAVKDWYERLAAASAPPPEGENSP